TTGRGAGAGQRNESVRDGREERPARTLTLSRTSRFAVVRAVPRGDARAAARRRHAAAGIAGVRPASRRLPTAPHASARIFGVRRDLARRRCSATAYPL